MDLHRSPLIFDGHNDLLLRLYRMRDKMGVRRILEGDDQGHLDLPRMRRGGFGGGLFTLFAPSTPSSPPSNHSSMNGKMNTADESPPLYPEIRTQQARSVILEELALLTRLVRDSRGGMRICTTVREIRRCFANGAIAVVIHLEGAEALGDDLQLLDTLHRAGLRSIGPLWSRPSRFGYGVPFRFPSSPEIGPGLTELGKKLVRTCNRMGIMIDVSHMTAAGFREVARISDAPLVAGHSNAHAVCRQSRNLTDDQLAAIRDSGGIVGLNLATAFLRPDGRRTGDTPLLYILRHLDHLIKHAGIDHVGFGTDFDGATVPATIADVAGLTNLRRAMRGHGFDEETMRKLCHDNWFRVMEKTFGG